jgi:hypothetical protein
MSSRIVRWPASDVAGTAGGEQLAHKPLLGGAEGSLAAMLELGGDAAPESALEQAVGVLRNDAEGVCELTGDGRLAGAHEADQDECHPIRCS